MCRQKFSVIYFATLLCFLLMGVFFRLHFAVSAEQLLAPYSGRELLVYGELEPASVRQQEKFASALVRCEEVRLVNLVSKESVFNAAQKQSSVPIKYNGRLRVLVQGKLPEAGKVVLQGKLETLTSLRNPGCFDAAAYNDVQNIGGLLTQVQLVQADNSISIRQQLELWNMELCARMERVAGKELGSILSSMVLGGSSKLDEETRELFTDNGIAHLLSVSGTHLLLLTGLLLIILKPVPQLYRQLLVIFVLVVYAALCGLRPPVLRALLMCGVLLLGGKGAERGRLLCLVAVVLLICKPLWLKDIGFQLSFAAAAGLLWLLPACKRLLPAPLSEGMAVTLAAQLATLPVEVMHFHQVSLIAVVSNLLLVPLLELAAQLALLGALLPWGEYLLQAAAFILQQALTQARWLAAFPYSTLVLGTLPGYCWFLYYVAVALAADFAWLQFFSNKERYTALSLCLGIFFGTFCYQSWRALPLTAYFLDVGQGDCAVIVTPKQKVVVIDTGGLRGLPTGSRVVAPFLRSLGYQKIDILLLSHYDFDHVGGCVSLMRQVRIDQLILPAEIIQGESQAACAQILQQAKLSRISKISVAERGVLQLDDFTKLDILDVADAPTSGNEASTLAAVSSAQGSVLLTGDMGEAREENLYLKQNYTVLKAGHHGSRYSTTSGFLAQARPQLTVFSCGRGNRYGHPHRETLERVRAFGSGVARTDEAGCVKVVFGDNEFSCYGYAEMRWQKLQTYNL